MNLIAAETSEKIRYANVPYIDLRVNGYSYINAKAARMLGFEHQHVLRFHYTEDLQKWFIANDPAQGATLNRDKGLYKFSDSKNVRLLFKSLQLDATKARFNLSTQTDLINGLTLLFITPKPYNIVK